MGSKFRPRLPEYLDGYIKPLKKIKPERLISFIERESLPPEKRKKLSILILSDLHGILVDRKAFDCLLSVIQGNQFDEIVSNGDALDLPYLSRHVKKLNTEHTVFDGYTEIGEIEFVKNELYAPLVEVANGAKIVHRDGNHDERITMPSSFNKDQLERLYTLHKHYKSTEIEVMLGLEELGIEYDGSKERNYFDMFSIVHGLKLSANAATMNIKLRFGSGTTGHTHRLGERHFNTPKGVFSWVESGCLRLLDKVEYLPTGITADWAHGFATATFDLSEEKPQMFLNNHIIKDGKCNFNGRIHSYKDFD